MDDKEFDNFFEPYSKNVDNANSLAFWQLSDEVITEIIKKHIPPPLVEQDTILDAGGGTGRWICDLSKIYKSNFILYDKSKDMLGMANGNIKKAAIDSRVKVLCGDLTDMSQVLSGSVNYVVSIYNPISFIYEKDKVVSELYRIMKKGGILIIMGHGFYNALASKINNYQASPEELEVINKDYMVKWASSVPKLNLFSKELMESLISGAGFNIVNTYGVPIFVSPGAEDFDPTNSKVSNISAALKDKYFYKKVFELEMKYNYLDTTVNRGMNILTVARK